MKIYRFNSAWRSICVAMAMVLSVGCASVMATAGSGLAGNLNSAIMNQDDPELVRDGAPAYLLMLDSFVEGVPENAAVLSAAAELYSAYGVVFVDDPNRARKLTARGQAYGQRAICASDERTCGIWDLPFEEFTIALHVVGRKHVAALYTFGLSWLAYIQAHSDDWAALARLPQARAVFQRIQVVDPGFQEANIEHFLGVLDTIRPPALGGNFESGLAHFRRAILLSDGLDLSVKVDFAKYYARTLYDRELHDEILTEVLESDPVQPGLTLFNTLAQDDAKAMLESADDYF